VTKPRTKKVAFTRYHNTTKQVLVQRRPQNWRKMKVHEIESELIRDPNELIGKTVYVRNGSAYLSRLNHLSDEIGGDINIVEADSNLNMEDLIEMVADGKIKYTVADENIAKLNQSYYSNLDISTELSLAQRIAWAVRKNSPILLKEINSWIDSMRRTADYYVIRKKYFENRRSYGTRLASDFLYHEGGQISEYDDLLKKYADSLKWDWRILASLIYQESQFDPTAQSWAGAVGLMQLMPSTAQMYEVADRTDPSENIEAGIKYLIYLDDFWKQYITSKTERIKFVLASYNIGLGHITDARKLAQKYGSDPNVWDDSVEFYLLQKSKSKYYNDDVVEYGYCRGIETVNYVKDILNRYNQYKQFVS
jgi:membrane-bound lytic murein transglycosylase F